MKRLKNIQGKNEQQFQAFPDQRKKQLDALKNIEPGSNLLKTISLFNRLSSEAKKLVEELIEDTKY